MANAYNKGDIVVMKSGGPPMTVDGVPGEVTSTGYERKEYLCRWFKGATQDSGTFEEHLLQTYVPPAKK